MMIVENSRVKRLVGCMAVLMISLCFVARVNAAEQAAAVTGVVFLDDNANGVKDANETGIRDVAVSDGIDIALTDRYGRYTIAHTNSKFIFIVTPAGYRNAGRFYRRLPADAAEFASDFPLLSYPESGRPNLIFAQITDTHVEDDARARNLIEDLNDITATKPAFIIATGDLTNNGSLPQLELYQQATQSISIPVINVIGNHDTGTKEGNYESLLGPNYYSFDWGSCHLVVLDSVSDSRQQMDWLRKDLSMLSGKKDILAFWHYQPSHALMSLLSEYKAKGIFTGHWHSNKTFIYNGVTYVNSPPLCFGGIDTSPRGFRSISIIDHKVTLTDCYSGCKQYFTLVSPADKSTVYGRKLTIRANFYDTVKHVDRAEYSLDGSAWKRLSRSGGWGWEAGAKGLKPGPHCLKARVFLNSGDELTKEARFHVSQHKAETPMPGRDWPMFKHNASRTSVTPDTVKPPLRLSWSQNLGGTIHVSSPVVANGFVYIGVSDDECRGRSGVYALDAGNGKIKWAHKTGSSVKHTVAVYKDRVYAVEVSGVVYSLDAKAGTVKWQYSLGSGIDRWVYTSPLVNDGIVYVGVAPSFVALDAATGERIWQAEPLGPDWISSLASPTLGASSLYIGFNWHPAIVGLDLTNGKKMWDHQVGIPQYSSPAYSDGVLYSCAGETLYALELESGKETWSFALTTPISSPAISGSSVYVGSSDGKLHAVDSATGKQRWSFQAGVSPLAFAPYSRARSPIISSPAITGDVVYFGSTDGRLYALNATSGNMTWSFDLGAPITASPAVSGNTVYIAAFDGSVYAFTESDGI